MTPVEESTRAQIDRILASEVFSSADGLRRLLSFLADKSLSGEANELKEYSIGVDAFGKPSTYDPRHDSTVRIQVGRLRQKLAEYYQTEGTGDPIVVKLPKGRYKLHWQPRPPMEAASAPADTPATVPRRRYALLGISACLIAVTAWAVYTNIRLSEERQLTAVFRGQWPPEIATLWQPFVNSKRPLLISVGTPLFVDLPGVGYFRDLSVNSPDDIAKSTTIATIEKALHLEPLQPFTDFATFGAANSAVLLARILAPRNANLSVVRGNELSWQQVSENNVIFLGSPRFFKLQQAGMPIEEELVVEPGVGIRNLKPRAEEPAIFADEHTRLAGTTYALVSLTPGPLGNTDVISFSTRIPAGITGAVAWFTEPPSASNLVAKLRGPSGKIPQYYQVLLKVRFQDGVPLETSYVLHRELHPLGR
ncbi:MAG: hypothetical protein ABSB35_07860 [Bryobacteraceae bacterium]|jgi:hypothetical protein